MVHDGESPIADRTNMVFAGTVVSEGSGLVIITETGRKTELGRLRALVAEVSAPPTPLERQLDQLGRQLVTLSLALCGVAFGLGLLRGVPLLEMFRTAISLAVAAVPEGLPAVATTTLALGMRRMFERQMIVRRLAAVESLGAITVISVDKTGTITENRMTVGRGTPAAATGLCPRPSTAAMARKSRPRPLSSIPRSNARWPSPSCATRPSSSGVRAG